MARQKFKLTGFARFFFVMIFLLPLAYIGASYYNGEDGIENIKNFFVNLTGGDSATDSETKQIEAPVDKSDEMTEQERLQKEIDKKNREIEELNKKLKEGSE